MSDNVKVKLKNIEAQYMYSVLNETQILGEEELIIAISLFDSFDEAVVAYEKAANDIIKEAQELRKATDVLRATDDKLVKNKKQGVEKMEKEIKGKEKELGKLAAQEVEVTIKETEGLKHAIISFISNGTGPEGHPAIKERIDLRALKIMRKIIEACSK